MRWPLLLLLAQGSSPLQIPGLGRSHNCIRRAIVAPLPSSSQQTVAQQPVRRASKVPPRPTLELSPQEAELFELLESVAMNTTCRVAGGWVRDKCCGGVFAAERDTPRDIDIALDDTNGVEFSNRVKAWIEERGEGCGVHTIVKNPAKSKHLETATMTIRGFSVDFVNLRTEEYCEESRVPTVKIGGPIEDAFRRDLTINSLFYNLRSREVEDLTGRGLADLKAKVIATPLPPAVTLLDDPLRLIRSVRFAARMGFTLSGDLVVAAKLPAVRSALLGKVSRERIGIEVDKMLSTPCQGSRDSMFGPLRATRLMHSLGVLPIALLEPAALFRRPLVATGCCDPMPVGESQDDRCTLAVQAMEVAESLLSSPRHSFLRQALGFPSLCANGDGFRDERRLIFLGALLLPWARLLTTSAEVKAAATGKPPPPPPPSPPPVRLCEAATKYLTSHSLKLSRRDGDTVDTIHAAAWAFARLVPKSPLLQDSVESPAYDRAQVGRTLRAAGPMWRAAVIAAIAEYVCAGPGDEAHAISLFGALVRWMDGEGFLGSLGPLRSDWNSSKPLLAVWEMRPLLDGDELQETLPGLSPGPDMGTVIDAMLRWQTSSREVYAAVSAQQLKGKRDAEIGVKRICSAFLVTEFPHWARNDGSAIGISCCSQARHSVGTGT